MKVNNKLSKFEAKALIDRVFMDLASSNSGDARSRFTTMAIARRKVIAILERTNCCGDRSVKPAFHKVQDGD